MEPGGLVLGVDVGDSANETFWTEFLRHLKDRGPDDVKLMISDAHAGLEAAIRRVFQNAGWQRCRVHAMRNLLGVARHDQRQVIAALIRTIFVPAARDQLRQVVDQLDGVAPAVAERLQAMEDDLLAYTSFPPGHWSKTWSNNTIEQLNRELKGRTEVVQTFPNVESVIRLVGALLVEINDEMIAAERRYIAAASVALSSTTPDRLPCLPASTDTSRDAVTSIWRLWTEGIPRHGIRCQVSVPVFQSGSRALRTGHCRRNVLFVR